MHCFEVSMTADDDGLSKVWMFLKRGRFRSMRSKLWTVVRCVLCTLCLLGAGTGNSVMKAMEILQQHSVDEDKVIVLTLFATPNGLCAISGQLS